MRRITRLLIVLFFCAVLTGVRAQVPGPNDNDIVGTWLTEDKTGEIYIYKDKDLYFGKIIGGNSDEHYDVHNPDETRRGDPLVGLVILNDLRFDTEGVWKEGTVYDPKKGKHYSCTVTLLDKNKLKITGYIGFTWIGRSEVWERIN